MKANEQTLQQVERALRKVTEKFPPTDDVSLLTDIHLRVSQESGELVAFDDDDQEITRCIVEQWIDNKDSSFYDDVTTTLRQVLNPLFYDAPRNLLVVIVESYQFARLLGNS